MYHEIIILGIIISLLFTEVTGLSAGLIIPGYLVLSLHSPLRLVMTLLVAMLAVLCCNLLSRWVILYGRRRFALLVLFTFLIASGLDLLGVLPGGMTVIGVLVPGIIAREFDRQGIVDTTLSLTVTTALLAILLLILGYPIIGL